MSGSMWWAMLACGTGSGVGPGAPPLPAAHGVMVQGLTIGEVTDRSARLWARTDARTVVHWEVTDGDNVLVGSVLVGEDGIAQVPGAALTLTPAVEYTVQAWASAERGPSPPADAATATFRTAPAPSTAAAVRLAWSGDLGGQNVCRDAAAGYPMFEAIRAAKPDVFVALGDMIYADGPCEATGALGNRQVPREVGVATDEASFLAHWAYNLADPAFVRMRAEVPVLPIWDDHEIVNDSGPQSAGAALLPAAERAYRRAWPLPDGPLYRTARWGRHLELFVLDTRSHRDAHVLADTDAAPKTLLGEAQRAWLLDGLKASDATWKVVVSSVPIALPTGAKGARDGWADVGDGTGYERELAGLFGALRLAGVRNLIFLTSDVHHAEGFRFVPFEDAPDFVVYELVAGPLSAGVFPGGGLDPTFRGTRLYVHEPLTATSIGTYEEALGWFNAGLLEIGADGTAKVRVIDANGRVVADTPLSPSGGTGGAAAP